MFGGKSPTTAIVYLSRGIELEPGDNAAKCNLAHCFLFKYKNEKSVKLYKEFFNQKFDNPSSLKNMIKQDAIFFWKNGFGNALIEMATKELNI